MIFSTSEKYGFIALNADINITLPTAVEVPPQFWISPKFPIGLPDNWNKWLGSFDVNSLGRCNLFVISKDVSSQPEVLDDENENHKKRVYYFYLGLLLTGYFFTSERPIILTGAYTEYGLEVRQISKMDQPSVVPGSPLAMIDKERIESSAEIAAAIESLIVNNKFSRFKKILKSFISGITSLDAEIKLHQFVRCIEGFIYPDIGKTEKHFKSRTELFIGPKHHQIMELMYKFRCAIEHLHEPLNESNKTNNESRMLEFTKHVFIAEGIARYLINKFLLSRHLWSHFESDDAINSFWILNPLEREEKWGDKLDFQPLMKSFDEDIARDLLLS